MQFEQTTLPWNDVPVRTTGDLHGYLAKLLSPPLANYLPRSISVCADPEIDDGQIESFISGMVHHLEGELSVRRKRRNRFVELGLFDNHEIDSFLTGRCGLQPWILYYSRDGGLRTPVLNPQETEATNGVVPCATMQNHGVAWRRTAEAEFDLWLVTARKDGRDWDWDSDIGHESAHAAFAQIPLYVQTDEKSAGLSDLTRVKSAAELNRFQLARLSYMFMETAVVAMRGERRENETGLPLAEQLHELYAFLELSHTLMPELGFDRALASYDRAKGQLDFEAGTEIFEIGAPAMRVVPHITSRIASLEVPTAGWFSSIADGLVVEAGR